jgi:hypothetical protein
MFLSQPLVITVIVIIFRIFIWQKNLEKIGKEEDEAHVAVGRGSGQVVSRARHKYTPLTNCKPKKTAVFGE